MTTESQKHELNRVSEEISLKELILQIQDWWSYLLSKWILILSLALLGGICGLAYSYIKKPLYTATTSFVLEDEKGAGGLGNLAGLASMAGVDLGGSGGGIFQGDNILQLYKSRTMIEKTLLTPVELDGKKELLIERYIDFNNLREKWAGKTDLLGLKFYADYSAREVQISDSKRLRDSVLGEVVKDINKYYLTVAKPDKKLSTIVVDVTAKDEFFAKSFNDELVKNVNEFYIQTKTKKSLQNVLILQHKADSVRAVMNGAIYTAVAVADATPNLNPTRQVQRVAPSQKAQFSIETNKAILGSLIQNLEMTKVGLLKETPLIQIVDEPVFPLPKQKMGKIKGIIFGGLLAGFLVVLFLLIKRGFSLAINA